MRDSSLMYPNSQSTTRPEARRSHNRHNELLESAARVFREKGYAMASMRDIAEGAGMTVGSIYYHYPAKSDLLRAVYEEGVKRWSETFDAAIDGLTDPWEAIHAAARNHLIRITAFRRPDADPDANYASVFIQIQPHDFPAEHAAAMLAMRDQYEERFRALMARLKLPRGVDRSVLRMQLIGALNHVPLWYRPTGKLTASAIANRMVQQLRQAMEIRP
jgi:AcrR family transcriptional regulator